MLKYPLKYVWVSKDCIGHGYPADDFGWWDYNPSDPEDTGRNPRLYAMADGVVIYIDNSKPDTPDYATYGNAIAIYYPSEDVTSWYAHIKKDSFFVKVGDTVRQGQPVARMGNSGNSYGEHLHMEICRGRGFRSHQGYDYLSSLVATSWNVIDPDTERDYPIKHQVITPTNRDVTVAQVYVSEGDCLRVREKPSVTSGVVGFADEGYYTVEEKMASDGFEWCRVGEYWIATPTDVSELRKACFAPTDEDIYKDQIAVEIDDLRIRADHSTMSEMCGWCPVGFYDVEDTSAEDDYVWIKTCGFWVACVDGVRYIPKQDDKDEQIRKLKEEVERLEKEVEELRGDVLVLEDINKSLTLAIESIEEICKNTL